MPGNNNLTLFGGGARHVRGVRRPRRPCGNRGYRFRLYSMYLSDQCRGVIYSRIVPKYACTICSAKSENDRKNDMQYRIAPKVSRWRVRRFYKILYEYIILYYTVIYTYISIYIVSGLLTDRNRR